MRMTQLAEQHIQFLQETQQEVVSESAFFISFQISNEKFRGNVKDIITGKFRGSEIVENLYLLSISDTYQLKVTLEQITTLRKYDLNLSGTFVVFIIPDNTVFRTEEIIIIP